MTCIAWDGRTLASDSALTSPGGTTLRCAKIGVVENCEDRPYLGSPGFVLFGATGHPSALQLAHEFLSGETDKLELDDDAEVLICSAVGCWVWSGKRPIQVLNGYHAALGIGSKAALAAMLNGADAVRAVETAISVSDGCAGPVQRFSLPDRRRDDPEFHEAQSED